MSSRKMSLSGWRPTRVTSAFSTYFAPASAPCFTTRTPVPTGSSLSPLPSSSSPSSTLGSSGKNATVLSFEGTSAAPQDEQKLTPSGFLWPHTRQNTALKVASCSSLCSRNFPGQTCPAKAIEDRGNRQADVSIHQVELYPEIRRAGRSGASAEAADKLRGLKDQTESASASAAAMSRAAWSTRWREDASSKPSA